MSIITPLSFTLPESDEANLRSFSRVCRWPKQVHLALLQVRISCGTVLDLTLHFPLLCASLRHILSTYLTACQHLFVLGEELEHHVFAHFPLHLQVLALAFLLFLFSCLLSEFHLLLLCQLGSSGTDLRHSSCIHALTSELLQATLYPLSTIFGAQLLYGVRAKILDATGTLNADQFECFVPESFNGGTIEVLDQMIPQIREGQQLQRKNKQTNKQASRQATVSSCIGGVFWFQRRSASFGERRSGRPLTGSAAPPGAQPTQPSPLPP